MKEISLCYAASEDDDEGTYFTWSKVVSNALDLEKYLAFQVFQSMFFLMHLVRLLNRHFLMLESV